jgi:hypothetical protein
MSSWLKKLNLQSPFWQGAGAIVSIIALIISTFIAYDIYQKSLRLPDLTIVHEYSFNPVDFGESSSKNIAMSIDGELVTDLEVYSYTLRNTGKAPVTPDDYIEPITVSVEEPLRILTVEKNRSNPDSVSVSWDEIDENEFQLKPLLLNPGDSIGILVFVTESSEETGSDDQISENSPASEEANNAETSENADDEQSSSSSNDKIGPSWAARIVNVSDLKVTTYEEIREAEVRQLGIFYTTFRHSGWSVYRFGITSCLLFLFGLSLGVNFGVLQKVSPLYYILLSVLMILSIVTGDNIASRINGWPQPLVSNVSVLLYLVLIMIFTFPALQRFFTKGSSAGQP